jgi:hypothetical protein
MVGADNRGNANPAEGLTALKDSKPDRDKDHQEGKVISRWEGLAAMDRVIQYVKHS